MHNYSRYWGYNGPIGRYQGSAGTNTIWILLQQGLNCPARDR
jgi:hypothetical protein